MNHPAPDSADSEYPPPCRLFFAERLPAGPETESAAEAESRVLLDLETCSPLPVEKLAYGWVRLPSREILYYAAPRERLPAHDSLAPAGSVLPGVEDILLPEGVSAEDFHRSSRDHHADLRPRPELADLRARASANLMLAKLSLPLRVGAIVGGVLLLVAAGFAVEQTLRTSRLDAQATMLKNAETHADLLASLERLEGPGRSVFDALAMVNPYRPESVAFTKVTFSDNRELTLEGRAGGGVSDINRMADALRAAGIFGAVELPKLDASGGRSTFRMRLTVTKWAKIADAPTAIAGVPAGENDPGAAASEKEAAQ